MLFNSFLFIALLPGAAVIYGFLRSRYPRVASQAWLLAISLGFYCYGALHALPLLAGSILLNWAVAKQLADTHRSRGARRRWAVFGVAANIIFLSAFKYVNFFLSSVRPLIGFQFALPDWGLPLGISFFTLTQIMYLVDCYEDLVPPSSLFDHATFVSFFPYLVAGPLTRAKTMVRQLHEKAHETPSAEEVARGFALFTLGLVKKTVFADSLVRLADTAFLAPQSTSTLEAWISVLAYWMQIYFDFSGYSDMAVGAARMMGFTIPFNFNSPYKSKSVIEFWQRWHITLSQFITTYLYTPILRAFKGRATVAKAAVASIIAMTVSGLWHGPAWTFVCWGLCHGVALAVNQYSRKKLKLQVPAALGWAFTSAFVVFAGILFRATSLGNACAVIGRLVPSGDPGTFNFATPEVLSYVMPSVLALPVAFFGPSSQDLVENLRPTFSTSLAYASLAFAAFVFMNSIQAKSFVYFGF